MVRKFSTFTARNVPVRVPQRVVRVQVRRPSVRPVVQVAAGKEQAVNHLPLVLHLVSLGCCFMLKNHWQGRCPCTPTLITARKGPVRVPQRVGRVQGRRPSGRPEAQVAAGKEL